MYRPSQKAIEGVNNSLLPAINGQGMELSHHSVSQRRVSSEIKREKRFRKGCNVLTLARTLMSEPDENRKQE